MFCRMNFRMASASWPPRCHGPAKANGLPVAEVHQLVASQVAGYYLGIFGAPYVNVLLLNEALAKLKS